MNITKKEQDFIRKQREEQHAIKQKEIDLQLERNEQQLKKHIRENNLINQIIEQFEKINSDLVSITSAEHPKLGTVKSIDSNVAQITIDITEHQVFEDYRSRSKGIEIKITDSNYKDTWYKKPQSVINRLQREQEKLKIETKQLNQQKIVQQQALQHLNDLYPNHSITLVREHKVHKRNFVKTIPDIYIVKSDKGSVHFEFQSRNNKVVVWPIKQTYNKDIKLQVIKLILD